MFWSFALASIPAAFIGGSIEVDVSLYKKILAVILVFAIIRLLNIVGKQNPQIRSIKIWQGIVVGAPIGFFSGLIGIGGGIILTPLILILHWGRMKEAAAVSALFIWVNSAAALSGLYLQGMIIDLQYLILVLLAFIGGLIGAYFGSRVFKNRLLRYLLAFVLAIASYKLFFA